MPSKKQRARQRKAAKAAAAPAARPVPPTPPADRTLRQLVRAHDRGIRRGFQRHDTYGDLDRGGGILSVATTLTDVRAEMGAVPRGSEARMTAPLRPPLLATLEQCKGGGVAPLTRC
eukprot:COSAG02_NODE_7038_length_3215_cov_4.631579_3_plen_117_part_00